MANKTLWSDEYWLLLMQLYLKKPMGVKPVYSREMVALALELHIHPKVLYDKMFQLRRMELPHIERLWGKYSKSPRKLARGVALLRRMKGFGLADDFYDGVELNESWERDFKPLPIASQQWTQITNIHLIVILDEYFRLHGLGHDLKERSHRPTRSEDDSQRVFDCFRTRRQSGRDVAADGTLPGDMGEVWRRES